MTFGNIISIYLYSELFSFEPEKSLFKPPNYCNEIRQDWVMTGDKNHHLLLYSFMAPIFFRFTQLLDIAFFMK